MSFADLRREPHLPSLVTSFVASFVTNGVTRFVRAAVCVAVVALPGAAWGQAGQAAVARPQIDVAVTYAAERSLKAYTADNFWMQGGAIELGTNSLHGFGLAAKVTGAHGGSIGVSTIPISIVTATFGPRYRWHAERKFSVYAEGLVGEANGFYSLFPTIFGAQSDANSFASQVGGGLDLKLTPRFSARLLDAAWQHTQLPNGSTNAQNDLRVGAGLVVRFGH